MISSRPETTRKDEPWTPRSYEDWAASQPDDEHPQLIASIQRKDKRALSRRSAILLTDAQTPPEGDWRTWLFLGGRGAGKTFAGACWLTEKATPGARLALVGPSLHDVREVMVDGPSGLIAQAEPTNPARYEPSRRRVRWANGALAYAFSAEDPESLRGPQFDAAWADEFCAWRRPGELMALLRMGLRRGDDPRLVVTTTPKPLATLRRLMAEPTTVETRATTADNAANLSPGFLETLETLYGGTRLAAQELQGQVVDEDGVALFRMADLIACRGPAPSQPFERIVVAVDPPVTATGDACGIVIAGRIGERAWVLADRSLARASPLAWAGRVAQVAEEFQAHAIVAEANQGGEMVRTVLAVAGAACPIVMVHATRSKRARAEPVAALYEQGRIVHTGAFPALEEELCALGSVDGPTKSPDRADALVWALTDLLLSPRAQPRLRAL